MNIEFVESTSSTNDHIRGIDKNFCLIWCDEQTSGRGQRGNNWESEKGLNLTFSIMVKPVFLAAERQFVLSKAIALSVCEVLCDLGVKTQIKWPNDIYIGDKKICGILIENDVAGNGNLLRTIIGVGLNVNQINFVSDAPNPTSIALETGKSHNRKKILEAISHKFEDMYSFIYEGLSHVIDRRYWDNLYRADKFYSFIDSDGEFEGKIVDITPYGAIIMDKKSNNSIIKKEYQFKEVIFVLDKNAL